MPKKKQQSRIALRVRYSRVPAKVRELLFVDAGGRCQFDGCNKFLFKHQLTQRRGNFAQVAHIVAFSAHGPRGSEPRPEEISDVDNLMLLCHPCHKLVDDNPDTYTVDILQDHKTAHEARIRHLTSLGPKRATTVVQISSQIADQQVSIEFNAILRAISPSYPRREDPISIEIPQLSDRDEGFWEAGRSYVRKEVGKILESKENREHVSVFPLAPIPLLMEFGNVLGNKVPMDLYQHHRDTDDWTWRDEPPVSFSLKHVRQTDSLRVALVMSLSGKIPLKALPKEVAESSNIYEVTLHDGELGLTFLQSRADLEAFRRAFPQFLTEIAVKHDSPETIDIFPAIPAPIAVLCGRELLPKSQPSLRVFDHDKKAKGFRYTFTINE